MLSEWILSLYSWPDQNIILILWRFKDQENIKICKEIQRLTRLEHELLGSEHQCSLRARERGLERENTRDSQYLALWASKHGLERVQQDKAHLATNHWSSVDCMQLTLSEQMGPRASGLNPPHINSFLFSFLGIYSLFLIFSGFYWERGHF